MPLNLGEVVPDFESETNEGPIKFHEWLGNSWAILFSHPRDYTPVCTTELGRAAKLAPEFQRRGVKMIALSCDDAESHRGWIKDLEAYCGVGSGKFPYPIIADHDRTLAVKFGMLDPDELNNEGMPLTARVVYVIGPDHKVKTLILYPATSGRNFDEILRIIDSLQLVAKHNVVTPVDWKSGDKVIVPPTVPAADLAKNYPKGVEVQPLPSGKEYLRYTPQP
ncbi:peroxiredoxin-6-like [Paramacrobiotus metropolitanus]|uniref:peroxiredoxin-6-like n=1 Tax=Paramacrobiotus metropolitanus TaxID=2943436 RepID=UPI002445DF4A|nr:peroxiredoxin-6-like [Paramacrobiotus metropolitanus]